MLFRSTKNFYSIKINHVNESYGKGKTNDFV